MYLLNELLVSWRINSQKKKIAAFNLDLKMYMIGLILMQNIHSSMGTNGRLAAS